GRRAGYAHPGLHKGLSQVRTWDVFVGRDTRTGAQRYDGDHQDDVNASQKRPVGATRTPVKRQATVLDFLKRHGTARRRNLPMTMNPTARSIGRWSVATTA